jgi:hypothetical protein
MKKVIDYKIVCAAHVEEVEKLVKTYMGTGWELLGPACCCQDRYSQTIVKYDAHEPETRPGEVPSTRKAEEVRRGF